MLCNLFVEYVTQEVTGSICRPCIICGETAKFARGCERLGEWSRTIVAAYPLSLLAIRVRVWTKMKVASRLPISDSIRHKWASSGFRHNNACLRFVYGLMPVFLSRVVLTSCLLVAMWAPFRQRWQTALGSRFTCGKKHVAPA